MDTLNDVILFSKLAELKSFTAVADELQLSRSLISKRISRLENKLGVQLVNRTTRRLRLTHAGETYYQYCSQVEQTLQDAEAAVSELRRQPRGRLAVNAPITYGQLVLSSLISGFLVEYPDISVALDLEDRFVDVIGGGYDVVIRIGKLKDSSLKARQIGSTRLRLIVHQDYLDKHGCPVHPEELVHHNCLLNRGQSNEWSYVNDGRDHTIHVKGNFVAQNGVPLLRAAEVGLGITLLPEFMLQQIQKRGVQIILKNFFNKRIGIYAIYPYSKNPPLNTRVFIDYLAENIRSTDNIIPADVA